MKKQIQIFDNASRILSSLQKGVLVTAKADGKVNSMTVSWGTLGIEWGKPVFTVFIRESRFTKTLLDKNPEFTVNIPWGDLDKNILSLCGTKSGAEMDKIAALGLTLEEPEAISVPGIRELPLTLECRVIYKQPQVPEAITEENMEKFYSSGDLHTAYYGQIVAAYLIED